MPCRCLESENELDSTTRILELRKGAIKRKLSLKRTRINENHQEESGVLVPEVEDSLELSFSSTIDDRSSSATSFETSEASSDATSQQRSCHGETEGSIPVPLVNVPDPNVAKQSYTTLRVTYLLVTLVVMLADGLQGTHLYVLYESYGYSVASLYCLGFFTGGLMSPITGPLVDRIGRKKAAILYCLLEIFINALEQYPILIGLIASRMIGGFTTNLLSQVFETWLDTEYRRRGLEKEKYEIIIRDSVIVSNLAAIFSGYLAHVLAESTGATGPFRGAVLCTAIALVVILTVWTENYGSCLSQGGKDGDKSSKKDMLGYFKEAVDAFRSDNKMLRVGAIQGLSVGSIQIFIFLWVPVLRDLSENATGPAWGLDSKHEPAYGLIFGAFMAAGVLGGLCAPTIRQFVSQMLSPLDDGGDEDLAITTVEVDGEEVEVRPMAVEFLAAFCYLMSAILLLVPCVFTVQFVNSFSVCLYAFLVFELLIGMLMPCEGVIRSLYFPATARASVMSLPRIIVNLAVSIGVLSTNFVSLRTAFAAVATMMMVSAALQLSLISQREWSSIYARICQCRESVVQPVACGLARLAPRSMVSFSVGESPSNSKPKVA